MTDAPVPPRSQVAPEHTWNAPSVFVSDQAWTDALKQLANNLPSITQYKGRLHEGPTVLLAALDKIESIQLELGKVLTYSLMSASVDTTNQASQSMEGRAASLAGNVAASISFLDPELLAIGRETLSQWMQQEKRLAIYEHYIDNLFRLQAHVRSAEVEEILGMVQDPFFATQSTYSVLSNADLRFRDARSSDGKRVPVVQGSVRKLLLNQDRETRRTMWETYAEGFLDAKNTFASNLLGAVKQDVFGARARRYNSALEASLFRSNIPVEVFHNLINVFKRNLPMWHRYWAVRRRILGYADLHTYDIWSPLTKDKPVVPFAQAVDWICKGMAPLGEEYVNALRRGCLQDRWVDIYPNQGKRSGAFSAGTKGTHPFIMMSFTGDLPTMSVLAHELGHSMHSYLTWKNQPTVYSDYSLFVAEVASNFNQSMVRAFLLKETPDPNFQIAVIEEAMENFHRYFFIMPTLARFELEFHQRVEGGDSPSADDLIKLMADLFAEGYGTEMQLDRQRDGITWAEFGHMYANFYVFQYATGISAAHALSRRVLSGEKGAADNYLAFLKVGGSLYPLDALKLAGVDLTSPEPVEQTFGILADMVDRLDKLTAGR